MPDVARSNSIENKSVRWRQAPLREAYLRDPSFALITYQAQSSSACVPATEPLTTAVLCGQHSSHYIAASVHRAFGGECNLPSPEELFATSIAAGLDTAIRMTASAMSIELTWLNVKVEIQVDARGALQMEPGVPVAFQSIDIDVLVSAATKTQRDQLALLIRKAEHCCAILQTLCSPPQVVITRIKT
ncbi:MAG: OsmC family protein [Pseudomonadota bacterium]